MFGRNVTDETRQISSILTNLRQRVLAGENMGGFKKELGQIASLIDKVNISEVHDRSVSTLSEVLTKSEREVKLMLKRLVLQDKKKKQNNEVQKKRVTVSMQLEKDLR